MAEPFRSSDEYDEQAHQLYNEARYDAALDLLREGLTRYPHAVDLHVGVGYAQLAREEYAWARAAFDTALHLDPGHEDALAGLGETLLVLGQLEGALRAFQQLIDLEFADDHELMLQVGRALFREGFFVEARRFFELGREHHPGSAEVAASLGYAAHRLGMDADAFYWLRRALELEPEYPEPRIYLANILYDRGEIPAALLHFARVKPDDHFDDLGVWRTIELLKVARHSSDSDPEIQPWLARLAELGRDADAEEMVLAEIESLQPDGSSRDPNQLELFGTLMRDVPGMQKRLTLSSGVHIIETLDGFTLRGTWDELVVHLQTVGGAWADGTLVQFMQVFARRGTAETGVKIPVSNPEAFLRGAAAAGVIRILQIREKREERSGVVFSQSPMPHPTDGLQREQLSNGLTLLVQRRRTAPAASLVCQVRAGFLDEPDDVVGISHVLEHMLFKGTPSLAPGELAQRTKSLGGTLNAYTSYDRTVYYASVPVRHAVELMALQADQVRNASLDADELRRELGVIIQEARRKLDSPGAVAGETLHELLYANHRLRRWRIGTEAVLERFTRDDVATYYHNRYLPSRTIVSFVGDLDETIALDALRAQWGDWTGPVIAVPAGPVEQGVPQIQARRLAGDVALADLVLGWRAPGVLDDEIPAFDLASAILGLGRGSRFSRSLRDTGLVNSFGVGSYGVVDAGVFSIGVELDPARLPDVLRVIGETIHDLATEEPTAAEFGRALTMLRARLGRRLERYESRASALADAESFGDVTRLDREEAELLAVTPAMVRDVIGRWIVPTGVSGVAYLPRESEAPFDAEMLRVGMGSGWDEQATAVQSAVPFILSAARDLQTQSATSPGGPSLRSGRGGSPRASAQDDRTVHHLALDNIDILTARFGETGQISLNVYRPREMRTTLATAGLAALTIRSMIRGTVRYDAGELAVAMESLGGTIGVSLGADVLGFGATVLSENISRAAGILGEVLQQPRFDPAGIAIERGILFDDARAVADDMVRFPMQLTLGVAFNDSDYGAPTLGTPESIASFDVARIRAWHEEMLSGGRTTIIAVGDAAPEQLAEEIAAALVLSEARDLQKSSHAEPGGPSLRSGRGVIIAPGTRVEYRDRKQSALAMLFPGPSRHDPERFAAETWSAIAAGLGGRLFESLRSKRSLAYTVIANSWQRQRAGGLLTYIATDPQRLAEARDAMLEELDLFRREPPSAEELARATATLVGGIEMSRQTAGEYAGEIADAWLLGAGLADLEDPAAPYRAVTAADVHALAAKSLDPAARAEGVVEAIAT